MEDITYIGEHLWAGQLGHGLLLASLVSIALSLFSFLTSELKKDDTWQRIGVITFRLHSLFLLAAIAIIFVMLYNSWYEYSYVFKHRNNAMPLRYILSCFWEGHEGSFMLWSFWHIVLGNFLIRSAREWTAPVLTFIAAANVFLGTMVIGVYIGDFRIGSSPFLLMRQLPEYIGLPWTELENYLDLPFFDDGQGLNPLLQNYWMTIHPPTVFFGFATTIVPAAFAFAGLWRGKYHEWIRPALPWTYLGILVLGVGILMGGAWAYEALSFGGFWAWDPVENSSLVPWIFIVAAGHVMLVNRNKARSTYSALLLALAGFIFVIYSNFLTNSGVLGETSVHAFTDNGLGGQLALYMGFFIALGLGMLMVHRPLRKAYWIATVMSFVIAAFSGQIKIAFHVWLLASLIMSIISYQRHYPKEPDDEKLWSREFWMFIGSLVLVMSALQITFMTSKPVFNILASPMRGGLMTLFDWTGWDSLESLATGTLAERSQDDVIADYNRWQTPFAFVITLMVAFVQFLRWKDTPKKKFLGGILPSALFAVILTVLTCLNFDLTPSKGHIGIILLFFGCWWAIVGNLDYLFRIAGGKIKTSGSSIAHIGFGLVILGASVSTSQSEKISQNSSLTDISQLNKEFSNQEDILLFKDQSMIMGDHYVSYREKYQEGVNIKFKVDYHKLLPRRYSKGELIFIAGEVYEAKEDHDAGLDMMQDLQAHWQPLGHEPSPEELIRTALWSPYAPGAQDFSLEPLIQTNPKFGNVPEPDTKHYWDKDIYTHVRYAQLDTEETKADEDGYMPYKDHRITVGDTLRSGARLAILDSLRQVKDLAAYGLDSTDLAVRALLRVLSPNDSMRYANPIWVLKDMDVIQPIAVELEELGVRFRFTEIIPEEGVVTIQVAEKEENIRDFIVMQAIMFPWINILWVGIIVMALGTLIAVVQRFRGLARRRRKEGA